MALSIASLARLIAARVSKANCFWGIFSNADSLAIFEEAIHPGYFIFIEANGFSFLFKENCPEC